MIFSGRSKLEVVIMNQKPKRHRYPVSIISFTVWSYHRFNDSYRDVSERLAYRGITVSYETIRLWCKKFSKSFINVIKKKERKPTDKWHLDEMNVNLNGDKFVLWRAVDSEGMELDVLLQKRKNKKSAIRFLSRLLGFYPSPRVIVTDKLPSYVKPIKYMMANSDHRRHKGLNNRAENSHQPTRRKEKCLIKFKSPSHIQLTLSLMGKTRNLFSVNVGRYKNSAHEQRCQFNLSKEIWNEAAQDLCA
ncbi:MAG: IS6 family transposase [Gammaproteobacteria bacterium]|nr:MAG: IS6 family transposase [Gammaproteobacteria bacterium]